MIIKCKNMATSEVTINIAFLIIHSMEKCFLTLCKYMLRFSIIFRESSNFLHVL